MKDRRVHLSKEQGRMILREANDMGYGMINPDLGE